MADFTALKTAIQTYIKQNGNEEITGEKLQEILLSVVTTLGDSAINNLVTALSDEVAARQNADGTLQQNITNEATARGNADTALGGRIDDEETARASGDTALSNRLGSTITAEDTAADQIGAEAEARTAADTALLELIDGITDNIENGYVYAGIATPSSTPASGKVFYLALTAGTYTNFGSTVVSQGINILKYNGSAWSLDAFIGIDDEPTPSSTGLPKSGGTFDFVIKNGSAFDISAHFASGGTLATYADLSAALAALDTLPAAYKMGGMVIRYVDSSDNNYIQARLMANSFTTDISAWQSVDDRPTAGSQNLVESGGVAQAISNVELEINGTDVIEYTYDYQTSTKGQARTIQERIDIKKGRKYIFYLRSETSASVRQITLRLRADSETSLAYNEAVVGDGQSYSTWDGTQRVAFTYIADADYPNCYLISFMDVNDNFDLISEISISCENALLPRIVQLEGDVNVKNYVKPTLDNIILRKEATPVSTFNGWLNKETSVLTESETAVTYYYDKSVIVKRCMTRGGLTAVIAYIDSDNKVIAFEYIGNQMPKYNCVGDISKYSNCVKIAVCVDSSYKCVVYELSEDDYQINDYLADGVLYNAFLSANGVATTLATCVCTDYIRVHVGDTFILKTKNGGEQNVAFYDINKVFKMKAGGATSEAEVTTHICSPVDGYMRVYGLHQLSVSSQINYPSLVKGDSIFEEDLIEWDETGYYLNANGIKTQASTNIYLRPSKIIRLKKSTEYVHFYGIVATPASGYKGIFFYTQTATFISAITVTPLHYSANDYWAADYVMHISEIPDNAVFYKVVGIDECSDADIQQKAPITDLDTRIYNVPKNHELALNLRGKKIANIGPSSSVYPSTMAWKNVVKLMTGVEITDYGVGGTGMSNLVTPTWNAQRQVDAMLASGVEYDYVFILGGGNDYSNDAPIGTIDSYTFKDNYDESSLETVCGGLNYCIKTILEALPNAQIIVFSPVTTFVSQAYWDPSTTYHNNIGKRLMEYVQALKDVCDNKHIPWYSLRNMGINEFNYTAYFRHDNLHMNIEGNRLLTSYVMKALKEHERI